MNIRVIPGEVSAGSLGGAYESADRTDQSIALWQPLLQSPDAELLPEKDFLDARALDMTRNDAFVLSGQVLHRNHIVGSLFSLSAKPNVAILSRLDRRLDDAWAIEFEDEVETLFTQWAESPRCWVDASQKNTFTELIRLAVGTYVPRGEVLATVEWRSDHPTYRTAIQMVDPARLSTPYGKLHDPNVRGGVVKNRNGVPLGYWIRKHHPRDVNFLARGIDDHVYVRAKKKFGRYQVIHILEQHGIDQTRGISEMVAALKEMRITKKFRDITLQSAVVNATYAATIESDLPPDLAYQTIGGGVTSGAEGFVRASETYLQSIAQYFGDDPSRYAHLDGVKIPYMFPGTKLSLNRAGEPGGVGGDFEKSLLRYIAANLGVTFEELSKDYSGTNYSSIKAGMVGTIKFMAARKRVAADSLANHVYMAWLEEAVNAGHLTTLPRGVPNWYEGLNAEAYARAEWVGTGRGQVDEMKETQAAILRIRHNLSTYEYEVRRIHGMDWRTMFRQKQHEKAMLEKYGLEEVADNTLNALSREPSEKEE